MLDFLECIANFFIPTWFWLFMQLLDSDWPANFLTGLSFWAHKINWYHQVVLVLLVGVETTDTVGDYYCNSNTYTFQKIWDHYIACCQTTRGSNTIRAVSYRTFCRYWQMQLPHIVIGKPRSDLCWTCQQHSIAIANTSDMEKKEVDIYIAQQNLYLY